MMSDKRGNDRSAPERDGAGSRSGRRERQHSAGATAAPAPGVGLPGSSDRIGRSGTVRLAPSGTIVFVQVDGTPGTPRRGYAGLGMVARSQVGEIFGWRCARATAHTSQQAEYQAIIAGLLFVLQHYPSQPVRFLSDSKVAVDQLTGRAMVRATTLQPFFDRAVALAARLPQVRFVAIPREQNHLADALAREALYGRPRFT
jgi:ribonuclease HI